MKKPVRIILAVLIVMIVMLAGLCAAGAETTEEAEWTVLYYICGSNLESENGYASSDLNEIMNVTYPDNVIAFLKAWNETNAFPDPQSRQSQTRPGKVNVLVETGGSSYWQMDPNIMDIRTDMLQRWRYDCYSIYDNPDYSLHNHFELLESCPLASMAAPETLTDFIRWGVKTCPAKKYALVLWDHGGGIKGMFIDELFDNNMMSLPEIRQALTDAGTTMEALLIDACMMANLETAWAVRDCARWMICSEETVSGDGTDVEKWLQELFCDPEMDGERLGRIICDKTQTRYSERGSIQAQNMLTWSVIDLSAVEPLADAMEKYFQALCEAFKSDHAAIPSFTYSITNAEEYGNGHQNMRDIAGFVEGANSSQFMDLALRNEIVRAIDRAVRCCVRGPGRGRARGISLWCPENAGAEELDLYAACCPLPSYLAYLDALSEWDAPDAVYEKAERLPEIKTVADYQLKMERVVTALGLPGLINISESTVNTSDISCRLYRMNERTGLRECLGNVWCSGDPETEGPVWTPDVLWNWPAVEHELCSLELHQVRYMQNYMEMAYHMPVQIDTNICYFRCVSRVGYLKDGQTQRTREYWISGVWEGDEDNITGMMSQTMKELSSLAGQEYQLLFPVEHSHAEEKINYSPGAHGTIRRSLLMEEIPLPAGTYYLEYEITDMFGRTFRLDQAEVYWDGEKVSLAEGVQWEGEVLLQ